MEVYLDNSATTRAFPEVGDLVRKILVEDYGNPSSLHNKGFEAEKYIRTARKQIADTLKVKEKEIVFTSCGTESDNLALIGVARANKRRGNHIISTKIEHPAIINTLIFLEEEGFDVTFLDVDKEGFVSLSDLKEALRPETILVSMMYVNNEVGAKEPVYEAAKIVKAFNKNILFHTDAVQGYGKYRIRPEKYGIDLISMSSHKIHGPKGTGALYIKEGTKISPILFGGEQQRNIRSGTENVPGIAGMGLAAEMVYRDLGKKTEKMRDLKQKLLEGLLEMEGTHINSPVGENSAPHILSCAFEDVRSEVLLHALEERDIFVSSGSACASNHPGISGVLASMGVEKKYLESTIRFSLSEFNTEEEIAYTLEALNGLVPVLRRFTRR